MLKGIYRGRRTTVTPEPSCRPTTRPREEDGHTLVHGRSGFLTTQAGQPRKQVRDSENPTTTFFVVFPVLLVISFLAQALRGRPPV